MRDDDLVTSIEADWRTASLDARRRTMLEYVEKLSLTPAEVRKADVDALRTAGFSDDDVLGIVECAAYYAYANRIADGLGIEVEGEGGR